MGASPTSCCELHDIYRTGATPNKRQSIANATYMSKHTAKCATHPKQCSLVKRRQTYWATHICQTHTHDFATGAAPIYKCVCEVAWLPLPWAGAQKAPHKALHPSMLGRSFLSMLNNLIAMRPTSAPRTPAVLILVQKSATDGTVWAKTGCHFGKLPKQPSLSFCPR